MSVSKNQKDKLGQVFTPYNIVLKMLELIDDTLLEKNCNVLEPACGNGAIIEEIEKKYEKSALNISYFAYEIDKTLFYPSIKADFLKTKIDVNFDLIVANPPYVDFKHHNYYEDTFNAFLNKNANLYYYFLDKCLDLLKPDGQLIFLIPSNCFFNTSAKGLIDKIYENFIITDFVLLDENNTFKDAKVSTAIIKIIRKTQENKIKHQKQMNNYKFINHKIFFNLKPIKANVVIKVGCVFKNKQEIKEDKEDKTSNSFLITSSSLKKARIKNAKSNEISINDCIKFNKNAYSYIRPTPKAPNKYKYRIFVNTKTRQNKPFFRLKDEENNNNNNNEIFYDGSILCIYVLEERDDLLETLNDYSWGDCFVFKDGRYNFSQSILEAIIQKED